MYPTSVDVTARSMMTGEVRTRRINMTRAQYELWQSGTVIQRAMPHLTPSEREFLITGASDEEWDTLKETE